MLDDEKTGAPERTSSEPKGWREIAERASKEKDPETLMKLVEELCDEIDHRRINQQEAARNVIAGADKKKPVLRSAG